LQLHAGRIFITEEYLEIARNPQEILKTFLTSYLYDLRFRLQKNTLQNGKKLGCIEME
jgi:hypothetical protein